MEKGLRVVEVSLFLSLFVVILLSFLPLLNVSISNQIYDFVYLLAEIIGLLFALIYALKIDKNQKLWLGWFFILLGLGAYFLKDLLNFLDQQNLSGILGILSFILIFVGILIFIIFISNSLRLRLTFNENFLLVINAILLFILILQVGLLPTLLSKDPLWDKVISVIYLLGNYFILVVFMILFLTVTTNFWGGEIARNYYLLALGIALLSVASIIFSYVLGSYELLKLDKIIYLGAYLVIVYAIVKEGLMHAV
ncbi:MULTISPECIES: hypothetical protein [Dictyoglomus]|uniref:Uncharacterized protein n=1 Tax=Dictyoglomus turgidum (strain DSM 6724 / Z-1310) TaxID=515635 RepID=B8E1J4_DICTD|nr:MULTISPECIES: hypothetical protein [Dictyoglomus]ACK41519.1 conserved hypothetical protein [Dictyoglomus turgidum DSM 6724]HBU31910.1 hypothetical protein [Dictyoglomus sp.]